MKGPLLKYTDKLYEIIDDISGPVAEMLLKIEGDYLLDNHLTNLDNLQFVSYLLVDANLNPNI